MGRMFLSILTALCMASACALTAAEPLPPVAIGGMEFTLEVARTDAERARGLMERRYLAEEGGMLFIQPAPQPAAMWMKNTRIPLDCLFLDADGRLLKAVTMKVEPPRRADESAAAYEKRLPVYCCDKPVAVVVELRAGMAQTLGLRPGDRFNGLALREIFRNLP